MQFNLFFRRVLQYLVIASFLGAGFAMAQQEPTMGEVYATAQAGKLDQAQIMVQQVLISHPNSAKAHFVQSELYARQGNMSRAREALATAEKLAPGLPFAKPEAVNALRAQLSSKAAVAAPGHYATPAVPSAPSSSWLLPVLLAGGVMVLGYFVFRRRAPSPQVQQPVYSGGLNGPQTFGSSGGAVMQPNYGQPMYGQPAGTGLGGKIMGGVATGLAVGAGVMAAEAIGRNLFGGHEQAPHQTDNFANDAYQPAPTNTDMGGQNFGINDTNSWDDGSSSGMGGGTDDWDS